VKISKYSVLLIPDVGEKKHQFTIRRSIILFVVVLFSFIILGAIAGLYYSVNTYADHRELQMKYEELAIDRTQVMEFMSDLQRMKQMDELIRKTLGTELNANGFENDSLDEFTENEFRISYIENIPSIAPVEGWLTQKTDLSSIFIEENHYGIDIAVKEGDPVVASASGWVVYSGWNYEMGNLIILSHGDGYFTLYGHNQSNLAEKLDRVHHGEVIALAGQTGISSGPHLHYEIWKDGETIDPLLFFPQFSNKDVSPNNE